MGWNPYSIDLQTEIDALTSRKAGFIDAACAFGFLLVMWLIAV